MDPSSALNRCAEFVHPGTSDGERVGCAEVDHRSISYAIPANTRSKTSNSFGLKGDCCKALPSYRPRIESGVTGAGISTKVNHLSERLFSGRVALADCYTTIVFVAEKWSTTWYP
jgi:hypothetical protein